MPPRRLASEPTGDDDMDSDDDGTGHLTDLLAKLTRAQQRQLAQKMAPTTTKSRPLRPLPPQRGQPQDSAGKQPAKARSVAGRLRLISRLVLTRLMPLLLIGAFLAWLLRETEDKIFYMPSGQHATAVREVLLANGWIEDPLHVEKATLLWLDDRDVRMARKRTLRPVQRVNSFEGVMSGRPDAVCRALREARGTWARATEASEPGFSLAECYVLPEQLGSLTERMRGEGGASHWLLQPVDAAARREAAEQSGGVPLLTNNPDALPPRGAWTVRLHEPRPLLLDQHEDRDEDQTKGQTKDQTKAQAKGQTKGQHKFVVEVFTVVSSIDPARPLGPRPAPHQPHRPPCRCHPGRPTGPLHCAAHAAQAAHTAHAAHAAHAPRPASHPSPRPSPRPST